MSDIERISEVLREAEAGRTAIGPVSDLVEGGLTLPLAHDICESNIARREAAGEHVAGFKVGFTNIAVRDKMGLPDSTYGYLMDGMVLESGGELAMDEMIAPKIESEICVRLVRRPGGPGRHCGGRARGQRRGARLVRDLRCAHPRLEVPVS